MQHYRRYCLQPKQQDLAPERTPQALVLMVALQLPLGLSCGWADESYLGSYMLLETISFSTDILNGCGD